MQQSSYADRRKISDIYSKELVDSGDVDALMSILDKSKSRVYVQALVEDYALSAGRSLDGLKLVDGTKAELDELVWFLTNREY